MVLVRLLLSVSVATLLNANGLMPLPVRMIPGQGRLPIDGTFRIELTGYREARLEAAAERTTRLLSAKTGMPFTSGPAAATLTVNCDRAGEVIQKVIEDESYRLEVTQRQARLSAPTPLGVLRGLATFYQLVDQDQSGFGAPAGIIEDRPRYPWRGLMLDVSRHWLPIDVMKRNLDGMSLVKLNVFHWHLSDDQGFRIESKVFPNLQQMGSDGLYFTQDQVREIIAYARERGIRVVPEFDMPGHSTSWFVGHPELAAGPGPYSIARTFGILDPAMDPTREEVYSFLDRFMGEMAALFPDEYFHVGGDEVNGKQWDANPRIQEFKKQHGINNNHELQAYFTERLMKIVQKHGKRLIGWDEVLLPGLPKDAVIHSWRGQKSLAEAASQGYMGILSNGYYLDLMQPAFSHYAVDPLGGGASSLSSEEKARILGGEGCEWAEMVTAENQEARVWPRMAVIAERLWSPGDVTDVNSMYTRMEQVSRDLEWTGLRHRSSYLSMLERLAAGGPVEPVMTLADIVEPVKQYQRHSFRKYDQFTPLTRLVDAARPESETARQFAAMDNRKEMRRWLERWRDNDVALYPVFRRSALLSEAAPVSMNVAALASAGLEALQYLESGQRAPADWLKAKQALLDSAAKPRAEVLISIVPAIRRLVESAAR